MEFSGWAVDPLGTININLHGNVVDFSCTVNTADKDKTVDLGRWPTTQLLSAGDTGTRPFSLRLEDVLGFSCDFIYGNAGI